MQADRGRCECVGRCQQLAASVEDGLNRREPTFASDQAPTQKHLRRTEHAYGSPEDRHPRHPLATRHVTRDGAFDELYGEMVERTGIIKRTASVLAGARERGVPIFYTRVCFGDGHPELVANSPLFELVGQKNALAEGSPGASIIPELAPHRGM
jgi:hypothetical protein